MERFNLCDYYDVWGNQKDGYEINAYSYPIRDESTDAISTTGLINDRDLLNYLKREGYLRPSVRINQVRFRDDCNGWVTIEDKKTDRPLYCFEFEEAR